VLLLLIRSYIFMFVTLRELFIFIVLSQQQ